MNEKQLQAKTESIESLILKARKIGRDTVPESMSELETKVITILRESKKIMTAKQMHEILQEKNPKFYSDKMWQLAKKGTLVKLATRGYYKYNFATKTE